MKSYKQFIAPICETADTGLAAKASKSGISIGTLRTVYRRGMAAWNSGHRPGTTPQQWAMARVNSYISKGSGTYGGADKDLHEGDTSNLPRVAKDKASGLPKKYVAGLSTSTAKDRAAHFDKMDKKSDRDPTAYEPAPGDANAKTKLSKHTLKYRAMFGENMDEEILEACWDSHKQVGMKKKGNHMVPNCVAEAANPAQQAAIAIAMKKADKKPKNEEVEELDELNKDTIYSYNKKSEKDQADQFNKIGKGIRDKDSKSANKAGHKFSMRSIGQNRAEKRLTNEEIEVGDKVSFNHPMTAAPGNFMKKIGTVHKVEDDTVHVKVKSKYGVMTHKKTASELTKEEVELDETPAWTRKEGKNPEGGLNRKGIASYRAANPGSKLSMAVTTPPSQLKAGSKAANRRKSFCARMGGMPGPMKDEKGEPTRKALSLRKWNC